MRKNFYKLFKQPSDKKVVLRALNVILGVSNEKTSPCLVRQTKKNIIINTIFCHPTKKRIKNEFDVRK